jgi:hypothetical protein
LVCADEVNLLSKNINITRKNTKALLEASREVGLEVNAKKTKYISCHQDAVENHNIMTASKSFENVAKFKCLGTKVTIFF